MTAGPVQAEAFRDIVDTFFRAGTEDDDRSSQFVGDDFGNIVNGLRIQPDGQVPLAAFAGHCGHIGLKLARHRDVVGHAMRFIIAQSFSRDILLI